MIFKNKKHIVRFILPVVILSIIILFIAAVYIEKSSSPQATGLRSTFPYDTHCDLHLAPCVTSLPTGGKVQLSISPKNIPLVKPLHLEVKLTDIQADSVEVDFVGLNMNMGFNRPQLNAKGAGQFEGNGMLPVCIRRSMDWEARVLVNTDNGLLVVPYRFTTSQ